VEITYVLLSVDFVFLKKLQDELTVDYFIFEVFTAEVPTWDKDDKMAVSKNLPSLGDGLLCFPRDLTYFKD
jgi:hypothetical protein